MCWEEDYQNYGGLDKGILNSSHNWVFLKAKWKMFNWKGIPTLYKRKKNNDYIE